MSVEEAILELLKDHNRVILPNFGAFLLAVDDPDSKPYVLFNGFLSFNDGLLVDYLAEKNNVDGLVASELVAEYVFGVKSALQESKIYKFNFLGTFDYDESGSMRFRYNPNVGRMPQKPGAHPPKPLVKEATPKDAKTTEKPQEKEEKALTTQKIEERKPDPEPLKDSELLKVDNSSAPNIVIESANHKKGSESDFKPPFDLESEKPAKIKEKPKENSSTQAPKKPEPKVVVPSDPIAVKRRNRIVFISFLVVLILGGLGSYIYFIYLPEAKLKEERRLAMEKVVIEKQARQKQMNDSIAVVRERELALADSIKQADEKVTVVGSYHIIVGAFAEEANADRMILKVKESNFPQVQKLVNKNRFMVSVESCANLEVAKKRVQVVSQSLGVDCWVYKSR